MVCRDHFVNSETARNPGQVDKLERADELTEPLGVRHVRRVSGSAIVAKPLTNFQ